MWQPVYCTDGMCSNPACDIANVEWQLGGTTSYFSCEATCFCTDFIFALLTPPKVETSGHLVPLCLRGTSYELHDGSTERMVENNATGWEVAVPSAFHIDISSTG